MHSPTESTELTVVIYLYKGRSHQRHQGSETPITDNPQNTTTIKTSRLSDSWCLECFPMFLKVCVHQHIASLLTPSIELGNFHSDRQCVDTLESLGGLQEQQLVLSSRAGQEQRQRVGCWKLSQARSSRGPNTERTPERSLSIIRRLHLYPGAAIPTQLKSNSSDIEIIYLGFSNFSLLSYLSFEGLHRSPLPTTLSGRCSTFRQTWSHLTFVSFSILDKSPLKLTSLYSLPKIKASLPTGYLLSTSNAFLVLIEYSHKVCVLIFHPEVSLD